MEIVEEDKKEEKNPAMKQAANEKKRTKEQQEDLDQQQKKISMAEKGMEREDQVRKHVRQQIAKATIITIGYAS